ncbi:MFS transporter [Kribbella sp. NPDC056861]|uniref:MFS transporter n=1 Tax=Kribbella sp. NPDC056861 TaxID=3154857 RepID=UPI00341FE23C
MTAEIASERTDTAPLNEVLTDTPPPTEPPSEPPTGQSSDPAPKSRWGLLKDGDFRRLWLGETTSTFGNAMSGIAVPVIALTVLGASSASVGLINAASWLPWLLVGLPAGAWIDRLPRRRTLLACDIAFFVLVASVPLAAWLGVLTLTQLIVVCLLGGVVSVFFAPAYGAYLPSLLKKEDLPEGNAKLQGSSQAAVVAGSSAGGGLIQVFGPIIGMVLDAATFVVSFVCLLGIKKREPRETTKPEPRTTTLRQEIAQGFKFVVRDPYLRVLTGGAAVDNLLLAAGHALLVVFLVRTLDLHPTVVGILMAFDCLGGVLGATVANKLSKKIGTARALLTWSLVTTPFGLLIPLATEGPGVALFALGLLIPSIGIVANNVIGGSFRQAYCPPDMLGRVATSGSFVSFSLIPLGALGGGFLGQAIGVREALFIVLLLGCVGKLILLIGPLKSTRDLPTEHPDYPATPEADATSDSVADSDSAATAELEAKSDTITKTDGADR